MNSTRIREIHGQGPAPEVQGHPGGSARGECPRSSRWIVAVIHGYQGLRAGRPSGCRYVPSCSDYAVEAVEGHGAAVGLLLTARRLARCTPWGGHGFDPVPEGRTSCSDH